MSKPALPLAAILTRVAVLGLGLALFFEQAEARQLLHLDATDGRVTMTPVYWVSLLAPIFFLSALWAASGAFVRMNRGEGFGPAMVCGLREIGVCLMIGVFAAIVVQPSLIFLIGNGFTDMRGAKFVVPDRFFAHESESQIVENALRTDMTFFDVCADPR
jgi:hypothetical protein